MAQLKTEGLIEMRPSGTCFRFTDRVRSGSPEHNLRGLGSGVAGHIERGNRTLRELRCVPLDCPFKPDDTVYIVEEDFGPKLGRVYRETNFAQCDRETTLQDLQTGPVLRARCA